MIISIMCQPPSPPVRDPESQRLCSHTFHDKGVHHLSRDRHETLCGIDCGTFVFINKLDDAGYTPGPMICTTCVEKLA